MKENPFGPSFPKVELHDHLDGGLRISTIEDLARSEAIRLPTPDRQGLTALLSPGPSSLENYLKAFDITVAVMQTASALERVAYEMVEDWAAEGIVYGEVRFAPEQHLRSGLSMAGVVEAVLKGLDQGRTAFGVESGLILSSMRHRPPTLETARLVREYRQDGVVGFDIAGAETPFPPRLHREAFEYCAEHYLATTCHAGEVTDPTYIREALIECRALRIGHGTQLVQEWSSPEPPPAGSLTRWILDRQIPLEMCLSSNVQTKACPTLFDHPFQKFLHSGLNVVLCTDNRLVSDTTLGQELERAATTWGLTTDELRRVQERALEAAFCPLQTKRRIRAKYFSGSADNKRV